MSSDALRWLHEHREPPASRKHLAGLSSVNHELLSFPCGSLGLCLLLSLSPTLRLDFSPGSGPGLPVFGSGALQAAHKNKLWASRLLGQHLPGVNLGQQRFASLHLQVI